MEDPGVPAHIGIIMDGNGRWAEKRGLPRTSGHKEGLETVKKIVSHASDRGIQCLSLYVFSTENWRRTEQEISFLMNLIHTHIRQQYKFYKERGIRIIHSGNIDQLPPNVRNEIILAERDTEDFSGLRINLLINYGGRNEIIRAVRRCIESAGMDALSEETLSLYLDQPELPALDLVIRTGGELRLSNFFLWQAAYAEFYFSDDFWPDWTPGHLDAAIASFQSRQRRFGRIIA